MKKTIFSCVLVLVLVWSAAADGLFGTIDGGMSPRSGLHTAPRPALTDTSAPV